MNIDQPEILIKLKDGTDESLKAIVSLRYGSMAINGFRVRISKKNSNFWVTPPSYQNKRSKTGWSPCVYFEDIKVWKSIEAKILDEFDKKVTESTEYISETN